MVVVLMNNIKRTLTMLIAFGKGVSTGRSIVMAAVSREELLKIAKPILFNTEMVRAILDGRKTVTRRCVKFLNGKNPSWTGYIKDGVTLYNGTNEPCIKQCKYHLGDILYVRETWCKNPNYNEYYFKTRPYGIAPYKLKWKPSIHMPKEAARIFLKVKDVRVERLQDITEEQAKAEGIREYSKDGKLWKYAVTDDWWIEYHHKYRKFFTGSWWQDMPRTAKEAFHHLWNSTLRRRDTPEWYANNWSGNPWVWVIQFERLECN